MQPYDFAQAREAAAQASRAQKPPRQAFGKSAREFAEKEERYRVALAKEIVRQHAEEGVAWTVAPDLARGNVNVARLRRERDIAEGVREAMQQAAWRRAADRKDTQRFIDWSARANWPRATGTRPSPSSSSRSEVVDDPHRRRARRSLAVRPGQLVLAVPRTARDLHVVVGREPPM
jgi:hypothetical protein